MQQEFAKSLTGKGGVTVKTLQALVFEIPSPTYEV